MGKLIKNTELIKLLIITGILLVASIVLYVIGYFTYGDIVDFNTFYLATFIFVAGFAFFSLLSTLLFSFKLLKNTKHNP